MASEVAAPVEEQQGFDLDKLVQFYEDAEEAAETAVKASNRDRDYYDNKQLSADEIKELNDRGQPDVVFNMIQPKVDYLLGFEATNRTDPRGFPRTPSDEEAANACTDALRYVKDEQDIDQKSSTVWENMLVEGYGGVELVVDEQAGDISVVEWDWSRLFHDPHSRKHDFSDARYKGGVIWMDLEEAKAQWKDAAEDLEDNSRPDNSTRHEDKPRSWFTGRNRRRVRICQMYYRHEGEWYWSHFTKGVKLDGGPVPFRDKKGRSFCPLFLQSAYVDRNNNRYGFVRFMVSPQDEINKRRSKSLHLIMQRQTLGEVGAVEDVGIMKQELAKPDGHVEINHGFRFEVIDTNQMVQGNYELLQQSIAHIQSVGPNAAMLGKNDKSESGRAILANQSGGQTELSRLLDRHRHFKRRVYEGIWNLIRQYKTAEWWVRVTDDENNVKFVGMNRPVTAREELTKKIEQAVAEQRIAPEQAQEAMMQIEQDPSLDQVVRMENVPAEMDMDIRIEEVPDVANVAQEQFDSLVQLAPAVTFPPEIYLKASSLRNKRELLESLKAPEPDPMQQEVQMRQIDQTLRRGEAEIEKIKAETIEKLTRADQTDAQTGQIVNPTIVEPGQAQQMQPQAQPQPFQ